LLTFTAVLSFTIDIPTVVSFLGGIPVWFHHGGKDYFGLFTQVQGAGSSSVYHLIIDQYYRGRLRRSAPHNQWVFDGEFADHADQFHEQVSRYQ